MRKSLVLACVSMILVQACSLVLLPASDITLPAITATITATSLPDLPSQATPAPLAAHTPSLTQSSPIPSATPTQRPPTPTATPTLIACLRTGGHVEVNEFTTSLLPQPLVYRIYFPPCYDEQPGASYPVLYLIHGQTYTDTQWDRLGVPEISDRLITAGQTAPFIVVMPRDRVWLEPTDDKFGLSVEQSLVPWVDEHYRTIPDRAHRAIGGLSRGGAWALDIGLSNPDLFGRIGLHSGFVFQSDIQQVYLWLYNLPPGLAPQIFMDIADQDAPEIKKSASWLEELLIRYDIPHEWHMYIGEHEEAYWQSHVEEYLRWYSQDW